MNSLDSDEGMTQPQFPMECLQHKNLYSKHIRLVLTKLVEFPKMEGSYEG
jgi:hypothetical protein